MSKDKEMLRHQIFVSVDRSQTTGTNGDGVSKYTKIFDTLKNIFEKTSPKTVS